MITALQFKVSCMPGLAKTFADEMRVRRETLGLSQEALGIPLGLDRNTVSRMERNAPNMSISKAVAVAEALGTSVAEMLGGIGSQKSAAEINAGVAQRIRQIRGELNLNQRELAERIGVDRNWVSAVESGKRNVTLQTLEKFAVALSVAPLDML
jgi:transcriptional regulator with XRE-family HTH domain